jgi:hypothetical protein
MPAARPRRYPQNYGFFPEVGSGLIPWIPLGCVAPENPLAFEPRFATPNTVPSGTFTTEVPVPGAGPRAKPVQVRRCPATVTRTGPTTRREARSTASVTLFTASWKGTGA